MGAGADRGTGAVETGAAEGTGTGAVSRSAGDTAAAAGAEYDAGKDGVGPLEASMVLRLLLAAKVLTLQVSECGVKLTLSPLIADTSLPLTLVEPEPRRVLSGATARRNAPPPF
jgi:hypothetical protein